MTEISRRQLAVYAVAVVLVVLLGGRALRAQGTSASADAGVSAAAFPAGSPGGDSAQRPAGGVTGAPGVEVSTDTERVLVHVAGAVRRPGVYTLHGDDRIQDAVRAAGGGRRGADLDALNLAAKVTDGQQVLVARRGARGATAAAGAALPAGATGPGAPLAPVNINAADATQLEALDGVGPAIAAKIVDWRTQNGPFRTVDDLAQVPGIGPKKLEAMRAQATT